VVLVGGGLVEVTRLATPPPAAEQAPQPQVASLRLVATDGGRAGGTATIQTSPAGRTVDLNVHGLPANPPGHMYACWLVGDDDSPAHPDRTVVGTFSVRDGTPATLHWTAAAGDSSSYRVVVTLETERAGAGAGGTLVLQQPRPVAS
jgi:hypothetical protein